MMRFFFLLLPFFGLASEYFGQLTVGEDVVVSEPYMHGPVNVITGDYVESNIDIVLPGPRAMVLCQRYCSGEEAAPVDARSKVYPNGHYDSVKRYNVLTTIDFYGAGSLWFSNFTIVNRHRKIIVKASNGREVIYQLESQKEGLLKLFSKKTFAPGETAPFYLCRYIFGANGKLRYKIEPLGRILKIEYEEGKVKSLSRSGECHRFDYDEGKTTVTDPYGRITVYWHEKNQLLNIDKFLDQKAYYSTYFTWVNDKLAKKEIIDFQQREVILSQSYFYDEQGNLIEEILEGNLTGRGWSSDTKTYTYTGNLLQTITTARLKTTMHYLPDSDLVDAIYIQGAPFQKREFFFYDENHLLIRTIQDDGSGQKAEDYTGVTFRKSEERELKNGLPASIIIKYWNEPSENGATFINSSLDLDERGKAGSKRSGPHEESIALAMDDEEDRSGKAAAGRIPDEFMKVAQKKEYLYNYDGKPLCEKVYTYDKSWVLESEQHWHYDAAGRCVQETNGTYSYDCLGNLVQENQAEHFYDKLNRRVKTVRNNLVESWEYDLLGNVLSHTDIFHNKTAYAYDDLNRLIAIRDPQGNTEEFTYDVLNYITSIKDKMGRRTSYQRTIRGEICSTTRPDGSVEWRSYTTDGLLAEEGFPGGLTIRYAYDAFQRVTEQEWFLHGKPQRKITNRYSAFFKLGTEEKPI